MRRIVVIGAGQAGLVLGIGLRRHGYEVTIVTERTAADLRGGRLISNQSLFHQALTRERELGINFWDAHAPEIGEVALAVSPEPGTGDPGIVWRAPLDHPGQSVDQRVKVSDWMAEFVRRGGEIRLRKVSPDDLDAYAAEFDLVLVAAGRGPQFDALFPREAAFSPYAEPQRTIGVLYVEPAGDEPLAAPGIRVGLAPRGSSSACRCGRSAAPSTGRGSSPSAAARSTAGTASTTSSGTSPSRGTCCAPIFPTTRGSWTSRGPAARWTCSTGPSSRWCGTR